MVPGSVDLLINMHVVVDLVSSSRSWQFNSEECRLMLMIGWCDSAKIVGRFDIIQEWMAIDRSIYSIESHSVFNMDLGEPIKR